MSSKYPLSIAPMMGRTDRHYRYFIRLITKYTFLYSEMITTDAILKGDRKKLLDFSLIEKPISLQLGGSDPAKLAECANIGEDYGYDEINLNVGCPSDRVQKGFFGACLMGDPTLVHKCLESMRKAVKIPITIKHRIGIDNKESYDDLKSFIETIVSSGVSRFTIHARIALLQGLSAQQNRVIPPLRYHDVYNIKKEFPHLEIEINGGILTLQDGLEHLKYVDAVMIGREAYDNPYLFNNADSLFFNQPNQNLSRVEVIEKMIPYVEEQVQLGTHSHHIIRHLHGLFAKEPGGKIFRKCLTDYMFKEKKTAFALRHFLTDIIPNNPHIYQL